jgi:hypothetical protein
MRLMGVLKRLDKLAERLPPGTDIANLQAYLDTLPPQRDKTDENPRIGRWFRHVPPRRPGLGKADG